jgi:hypothetical protein
MDKRTSSRAVVVLYLLATLLALLPRAGLAARTAAELSFNDLLGATYDQQTGELILAGANEPALPTLDLSDLTVALRTRYDFLAAPNQQWPGVTIEFSPTNSSALDVIYFGNVRNTHFGYVLFEADRLLKYYGMGYDNSTGAPVPISSNVPGYKSELACLNESGYVPPAGQIIQWRKWFSPTLTISATADATGMVFDQARMTLNWAYDSTARNAKVDQCVQSFVDHFNTHYNAFADEQQARGNLVLHELIQVAKLTAIAEWLQSREIDGKIPGLNARWLNNVAVPTVTTPNTTPRITVDGTSLSQSGGVAMYIPPESFVAASDQAKNLIAAMLASRPAGASSWPIEPCALTAGAPSPAAQCPLARAMPVVYNHIKLDQGNLEGAVRYTGQPPRGDEATLLFTDKGRFWQEVDLSEIEPPVTLMFWFGVQPNAALMRALPRFGLAHPARDDYRIQAPPSDFLYVRVIPAQGPPVTLQAITDQDESGVWLPSAGFDLSAYAGQKITIEFSTEISSPSPTYFFVGAIELNSNPPKKLIYLPLILR